MTMSAMNEFGTLINCYQESKNKLMGLVSSSTDTSMEKILVAIRETESNLEQTYDELINTKPRNIEETYTKAQFFVNEILSEVELSNYQTEALETILQDISSQQTR